MKIQVLLLALLVVALPAGAASAKVIKVLPHFVDQKGRVALNPSLFARDAYQAHLRTHPAERSGLRFDVQWRGRGAGELRLRLELRGQLGRKPTTHILEQPVRQSGLFSKWANLPLTGDEYTKFGELTAWRATLLSGDNPVAEQKSFLW